MKRNLPCLAVIAAILSLGACSEPAEPPSPSAAATPESVPIPAVPPPPAATTPESAPDVTVQQLMRDVIEPNVQRLWRAVSYTVTQEGVNETMPISEMDWDGLRHSAVTLLEASHGLTLLERPVADAGYDDTRQAFQYTAAEIAQRRASNSADWLAISLGMRDLVRDTLEAVERHDIFALTESGAAINQACEACHASYWYHP
ncbi:MAG TPA: hypothetical protein VNR18_11280 [Hyphomicrobiales bacterium]|nr:hypothetical protein [Hyphomicrobiales bacterium]